MQTPNICYVFSQETLEKAVSDWLSAQKATNPEREEALAISAAALPWLLKHLNSTAPVHSFTHTHLLNEIDVWKAEQIAAYPHQTQRINESCEDILQFFQSDTVKQLKMIVETQK